MKKIFFAIILALCMSLSVLFVSCDDGDKIKIYVPDGAPALAVANILDCGKVGKYNAQVNITTGEDVVAKCSGLNAEADVAVLPTNAAVKICASSDDYELFTVNVWGILYVLGWDNITNLSDLEGKTVKSIGLGNTGEYLFKKILDVNNIGYNGDGVELNYVSDGTEAIAAIMQNMCDFILVGEPAATNAINKAQAQGKTLYRVFNLQTLWQQVTASESVGYPQASVIVKKTLLEEDGFADSLYSLLSENNEFLKTHVDGLKDLLVSAGSAVTSDYSTAIIESCNLKTVKAIEVKQDIYDYLSQFSGPFAGLLKDELYYEFSN